MKEGTVTISLKEYEELKHLKDNHLAEAYKLADKIHKGWAKSKIYWTALEDEKRIKENEYAQFLQRNTEHWKNNYFSLRKKVEVHNERFLSRKIEV